MDHSQLVEALQQPGFYPHPVERVEYVQTHISSVFLTGELVYKLKKPVDFGFLDFSTLQLRETYCRAELELNRRLAPSVYLRVQPLTRRGAELSLEEHHEVIDWLVVMRQMDQCQLGPAVLARGELTPAHIDALVDQLVPFYQTAATGGEVDQYGEIAKVKLNTDENFKQTAAFVGRALSQRQYDDIISYTNLFYETQQALFARRIAEGRIRAFHGDLHLGNICFEQPPVIFDCIEFNPRLNCGDVAADIAFLLMDLEFRGRQELADRFLTHYLELSGDIELPLLLDYYRCYRAYVRGKIACFTSADPGLAEDARQRELATAQQYFALAHHYTQGEAT